MHLNVSGNGIADIMPMIRAKKVWFVRHGESEANAGKLTYDPAQINLTKTGKDQARAVVKRFSEAPGLIVTSRYIRTQQTAHPLRKKYPHVKHAQWDVHEFTYLAPDRCRNTTTRDRFPEVQRYWDACDPDYCDGALAESFNDFIKRVIDTRRKLLERREDHIAVFSHCQFILAYVWLEKKRTHHFTKRGMREYKEYLRSNDIPNCGIIERIL